jgi:hypothetical protein
VSEGFTEITMATDLPLCKSNAVRASHYMQDGVSVYADWRGDFYFRLAKDPRPRRDAVVWSFEKGRVSEGDLSS